MSVRGALPAGLPRFAPETIVATWFGIGLLKGAPGSWASLAALPLGYAAGEIGGPSAVALLAALVCGLGLWACARVLDRLGADRHADPSLCVVDEVAGQLIALVPATASPPLACAAFVLFRGLDIWKPWPIRLVDRHVAGAAGIMGDDALAGLGAAAGVVLLSLAL